MAESAEHSQHLLRRVVERSGRSSGIQLPVDFVRGARSRTPPAAQIVHRGGGVRLKVYLCIYLLAVKSPYHIRGQIPSRVWAEMLELSDPEGNGSRRVSDALLWLGQHKFIGLERRAGSPPKIQLLNPLGGGSSFTRPRSPYVRLPLGFWTEGWITRLSGPAIAVLLVLLDVQGGKSRRGQAHFLTGEEKMKYGLSEDYWTKATAELRTSGLVDVRRRSQGKEFDWARMRNTYRINLNQLEPTPAQWEQTRSGIRFTASSKQNR